VATHTSAGDGSTGNETTGATTGTVQHGEGVDVSIAVSQAQFTCLKKSGYDLAVVRAFRSNGSPDTNAPATLKNAKAAGLKTDVYMFPCPRCTTTAQQQVNAAVSALKIASATFYDIFWFDIEGTQYWKDSAYNQQWLTAAVAAANALGLKIGIYTSAAQWSVIMGPYTAFSQYPLWYAHFDDSATFGDFKSFGGWTTPIMKQFSGDTTRCAISVDINFF